MLIELVKKSWKPFILIALVSLITTSLFNITNMMIETQTVNGIQIKTFNVRIYLENISNSWATNALNFDEIIPPVQWQNISGNVLQQQFWSALINNLAFIADWAYFPINFILWILRWLCWLIKLLLAIIGWNTMKNNNGNYYSELVHILSWITENLMIPYIEP